MDQHIEHILNQIPGWNAADASSGSLSWWYYQSELSRRYWRRNLCVTHRREGHAPAWHRSWTRKHLHFNCRAGWRRSRGYSLSAWRRRACHSFYRWHRHDTRNCGSTRYATPYRRFNETLSCWTRLPRHFFSIRTQCAAIIHWHSKITLPFPNRSLRFLP